MTWFFKILIQMLNLFSVDLCLSFTTPVLFHTHSFLNKL